ncbi:ATP-dependent Clp protease ATP-binding subunit ClpX [Anaeromyxobacter sp. PSR-1]|uniref:ATP-dependent Clp protease ATP-binding subunit ClpX n=1 Tax=Anaeromyxobacter sp. PSR-1 TaxID=1300915 RepID=UPI0005E1FA57|nr:ATP-dependent Clp protease ATP-binding subunit ClpX [Anaeromyxobacter sp. PSR-1]GAO02938.1 ATP-dependent Clp protease ATP-binding subunit ClpX [Anaeromyxobacter sp. PSR-1]
MKPPLRLDEPLPVLTPREIHARLSQYVIGQEHAKRALAVAAYGHAKRVALRRASREVALQKSNVLLIGPTGCGKTHLARHLARVLEVPFHVADATEFTEAGYYGKDVETMIGELLLRASHSIEEAQRGIVFVDEVDKIARRSQPVRGGAGQRDIGGEGVQQALLKLLEGREVHVPLGLGGPQWARRDTVPVDTTDILFVCAGTFSDLFAYGGDGRSLGFGAARPGTTAARRRIRPRDLVEYGMLAEFLGRLPVVVQLDELGPEALLEVLTGPPDAVLRQMRALLAADGVELDVTEGALRELVAFARERGAGARGLRAVVEEALAELLFEAPERGGTRVLLDAAWVRARLEAIGPGMLAAEEPERLAGG